MSSRYSRLIAEPYLQEFRFLRRRKMFDIVVQQILRQSDLFGQGAADGMDEQVDLPLIGTLLAAARAAQRMGLRELAAETRIDHKTISRIERGRANPTIGSLQQIAKALGKQLQVLLVDVNEKKSVDPQQQAHGRNGGVAKEARTAEQRAENRKWESLLACLPKPAELPPLPTLEELFGMRPGARGNGLG